jgi:hypothetical protein
MSDGWLVRILPRMVKPQRIALNIGGAQFHTTMDTLSNGESSMLASMCSGQWQEGEEEEIFIDRDGTHFRYILNHFRGGKSARLGV